MIRRLAHGLGVLAIALLISAGARAQQAEWAAVVDRLHAAMLEVMGKSATDGFQERFDGLAPAITEAFDFSRMARTLVGRHWKTLDDAERDTLIRVLRGFTIAKYAARFDGQSAKRFRLIDAKPGSHGTTIVRAEVVGHGDEAIALTYILLDDRVGRLRIADVLLMGAVSELARLRTRYTSVIKRKGFDALIEAVELETARLAACSGRPAPVVGDSRLGGCPRSAAAPSLVGRKD